MPTVKVVVRIKQDACVYIHVYMPDTELLLQSQMVIGVPVKIISNQMAETGSGSPLGPWCTEGDTGERESRYWALAGLGKGSWGCGHRQQKEEVWVSCAGPLVALLPKKRSKLE